MIAPTMQSEVKIDHAIAGSVHVIYLYASPDAAADFGRFGLIERWTAKPDYYQLDVDARYDFAEVVAYIEAYGKVTA